MKDVDRELRDLVRDLNREKREAEPLPTSDELISWAFDELPPEQADRFLDRIAADADAARTLVDLRGSPVDADTREIEGPDLQRVWGRVRSQLPAHSGLAGLPRQRLATAPRWLQAVAAALLVTSLMLGVQFVELQSRIAESSAPRANVEVLSPMPDEVTDRAVVNPIASSGGGDRLILILNYAGPDDFDDFGLRRSNSQGGLVWSGDGLVRNPLYGSLTLD